MSAGQDVFMVVVHLWGEGQVCIHPIPLYHHHHQARGFKHRESTTRGALPCTKSGLCRRRIPDKVGNEERSDAPLIQYTIFPINYASCMGSFSVVCGLGVSHCFKIQYHLTDFVMSP